MAPSTYQSFIDDPRQLQLLEGRRYVVLRPAGSVSTVFEEVRGRLGERLRDAPVGYIARPHVTLCGFAPGTSLPTLQDLVQTWASAVPPVRVEIVRLSTLPPPVKIAIVEVRRTPALVAAITELRRRAEAAGVSALTVVPIDRWIFHLSIAYCGRLDAGEWDGVKRFLEAQKVAAVGDEVKAVEVVAFDEAREYSGGVYALGGDGGPLPDGRGTP